MIIDAEDAREAAEFRAKELEPAAQPWTTMTACYDDMSVCLLYTSPSPRD